MLGIALLLAGCTAWAGFLEETYNIGMQCLNASDLACAQFARNTLIEDESDEDRTLVLDAHTLFHEGRYAEAMERIDTLSLLGVEMGDSNTPFQATYEAAQGFVEASGDGVTVRYAEG
ncbi:MAG: hypothetical protein QGG40_22070, partial [Myxococcota bacterium]|nr:hypothetical protein [Myxococcota bacterium]